MGWHGWWWGWRDPTFVRAGDRIRAVCVHTLCPPNRLPTPHCSTDVMNANVAVKVLPWCCACSWRCYRCCCRCREPLSSPHREAWQPFCGPVDRCALPSDPTGLRQRWCSCRHLTRPPCFCRFWRSLLPRCPLCGLAGWPTPSSLGRPSSWGCSRSIQWSSAPQVAGEGAGGVLLPVGGPCRPGELSSSGWCPPRASRTGRTSAGATKYWWNKWREQHAHPACLPGCMPACPPSSSLTCRGQGHGGDQPASSRPHEPLLPLRPLHVCGRCSGPLAPGHTRWGPVHACQPGLYHTWGPAAWMPCACVNALGLLLRECPGSTAA